MAVLDPDANEIVIRVVYDGPPEAGKTTSLRALAASFSQTSVTPEEDASGRTQWFDWMEYVGGRFEGSLIRCQIVSVPGQRELWERRRALLESADVVVFVADSTAERWDTSIDYLFELRELIVPEPTDTYVAPVGVVLQANKRDMPNAVGLDDLRARLGDARWSVGIVESIASDGAGIREAFVYAVRLALDRVRDLVAHGALPTGTPELTSPEQLLRKLREADERAQIVAPPVAPAEDVLPDVVPVRVASAEGTVIAELLREVFALDEGAPRRPAAAGTPALPDASAPSGAIWPPVEGRAILLEVSRLSIAARRLANGDWSAGLGTGWRVVSRRDAVFDSLDAGRAALIAWARLHAACGQSVSPHRCIVLAEAGNDSWRLWQIVRAETSLREQTESAAREATADLALSHICQAAMLLVDLHERLGDLPCELECSLDTVGQCDSSGMYIGLMPTSSSEDRPRARLGVNALLVTELGPLLSLDLASIKHELGRALEQMPRRFQHADTVVASLQRLLA